MSDENNVNVVDDCIDGMTILEFLSYDENRVLNVKLSDDKRTVELKEACEGYFRANLNKLNFGRFIDELNVIYDNMV